jgi:hypothetical protein
VSAVGNDAVPHVGGAPEIPRAEAGLEAPVIPAAATSPDTTLPIPAAATSADSAGHKEVVAAASVSAAGDDAACHVQPPEIPSTDAGLEAPAIPTAATSPDTTLPIPTAATSADSAGHKEVVAAASVSAAGDDAACHVQPPENQSTEAGLDSPAIPTAATSQPSISSCSPSVVSTAGIACSGVSGSGFSCIAERKREEEREEVVRPLTATELMVLVAAPPSPLAECGCPSPSQVLQDRVCDSSGTPITTPDDTLKSQQRTPSLRRHAADFSTEDSTPSSTKSFARARDLRNVGQFGGGGSAAPSPRLSPPRTLGSPDRKRRPETDTEVLRPTQTSESPSRVSYWVPANLPRAYLHTDMLVGVGSQPVPTGTVPGTTACSRDDARTPEPPRSEHLKSIALESLRSEDEDELPFKRSFARKVIVCLAGGRFPRGHERYGGEGGGRGRATSSGSPVTGLQVYCFRSWSDGRR